MTDTSTTNLLFEGMMTTVRTYLEASPELGEIRICTYGVNGEPKIRKRSRCPMIFRPRSKSC